MSCDAMPAVVLSCTVCVFPNRYDWYHRQRNHDSTSAFLMIFDPESTSLEVVAATDQMNQLVSGYGSDRTENPARFIARIAARSPEHVHLNVHSPLAQEALALAHKASK